MSRWSFDTSIPTAMKSMVTLPCLIGLRALRPRRLFGFNGLTGGAPNSPTVFKDPGRFGHPPVTATGAYPSRGIQSYKGASTNAAALGHAASPFLTHH